MHRRRIHLIGDSIATGWALGRYEEEITPSYPWYPVKLFCSISSMANNVLYENGVRDEVYYTGIPAVNLSSDIAVTVANIRASIANGTIRSGDVVVAEDAGPHCEDPDLYQAQWEQIRAAVTDRFDITLVMMSMFSYPNAPANSQYHTLFGTEPNRRSMNEATYAASQATIPNERGQTLWLDMKAPMDTWRASAKSIDNVDVMHPDDIHPNVWGQMLMVGELLKLLRYRPHLNTCNGLQSVARANHTLLTYGSSTFTASRAAQYVQHCILRQYP